MFLTSHASHSLSPLHLAPAGGEVPSHDDSTFLYTDPPSALGFWFALEDCTTSNGCLSFLPGSHKLNRPIAKRFVRKQASGEGGTTFETLIPKDTLEEETKPGAKRDWDGPRYADDWKVGECKAGTLVLIDGAVIHRSEKNLSEKSRFIYTVSFFPELGSTGRQGGVL